MDATKWVARTSVVSALASALGATTCCTIPTLLGALGLGGAIASGMSAIPVVGFLSEYRALVFVTTGLLLMLSWAAMAARLPAKWLGSVTCPPGGASPTTRRLWWISVGVYVVTLGVSFGAPIARSIWT